MSKLDDVMVNRELSNVSKMLYSYMYKSTGDEEIATKEWVQNQLTGIETLLANI